MSYMKQPAAGLVRLALDRWQLRGMRADNISAIVVLLDSSDEPVEPVTAKCRDSYRPTKDVLRRVRFRRQRRLGLRTVLGKICRLRAQRNLGSVSVMRSPLGSCNRLSAALQQQDTDDAVRPVTNAGASLRRPLRRHSYQEACRDAADAEKTSVQQRRLRVVVRRLSVDIRRSCVDLSDDMNNCGHQNSDDDMAVSGDSVSEERLPEKELGDSHARSEPVHLVATTSDARSDDDSMETSLWHSAVDLYCPPAIDRPVDIQCVSA